MFASGPSSHARPVAGTLATAPNRVRSAFRFTRLTFGNMTSQRISSGVLVPIWVCTLSVNSSNVWRSSESISGRESTSICASDGKSSSIRSRNS